MSWGAQGEGSVVGALHKKNLEQVKGQPVFEIRGKQFNIKKFPHLKTWDLLPILGDLLIVPMIVAASPEDLTISEDSEDVMESFIVDRIPDAVGLLFTKLREAPVKELISELLSETYVQGSTTPVNINEDFEDASDILLALTEVIKVNYMGFIKVASTGDILSTLMSTSQIQNSLQSSQNQ